MGEPHSIPPHDKAGEEPFDPTTVGPHRLDQGIHWEHPVTIKLYRYLNGDIMMHAWCEEKDCDYDSWF